LIVHVRQVTGEYQGALRNMAIVTLLSAIVPLLLRPPAVWPKAPEKESEQGSVRRWIAS
jgi:hypothetical protein